MKYLLICLFMGLVPHLSGQDNPVKATPGEMRLDNATKRSIVLDESLVAHIPFRNIGPTIFSGRVSAIAVHPEDPSIFYVAYASGGLWKTENNGTTFTPLFDSEEDMTIGALAVDWSEGIIWIGTGEVNSSRSSYAGTGVYKSADDGDSWTYMGLPDSHHIGKIILHPQDSNIAWIAVLGHLYSPNTERGLYKTTDGGMTWTQVLYIDENTGVVDMVMDPGNSNILYAAAWQRTRRAWNFVESGVGSGIYKSTDGGNTWTHLNTGDNGFPVGEGVGRIGLDITNAGGKNRIYALLDNYNRRAKEEKTEDGLVKDDFKSMNLEGFKAISEEALETYLRDNGFPEKYSAQKVMDMVNEGAVEISDLATYLENANSLLFDTPVIGAEVYMSEDGGMTWRKTHEDYLDNLYNSYGYYFGQIRATQYDPDVVYILGVPILRSDDGGKTFTNINKPNVHADHHDLWVNNARPGHIVNGNDGGVNISYDCGENWIKCNNPAVGQFYYITVDMDKPYNVYGGTQDNGVWVGPSTYTSSTRWHSIGKYPYTSIMGGDGMQVQVDSRDNNTVYTGFQFGNYFRLKKNGGRRNYITPKHDLGQPQYRWNWQSPIHLSMHNEDILYMGSNMLHRSMDKGESFKEISGDLTKGGLQGDVPYGTLTSIHESPLTFGLIYAGSDDGYIHVTRDGGYSWTRISDNLPQDLWVARVQASQHNEGTVYTALNGYRWDDFTPYMYISHDYGATWTRIGQDLPYHPVNVIKEDPKDENILYVGTDNGVYVTIDGGQTFMAFNEGLNSVPVHDLVIHPRDDDLVIGTHGRSIYIGDIAPVRKLVDIMDEDIYVFDAKDIYHRDNWGSRRNVYSEYRTPEVSFAVYSSTAREITFEVTTEEDTSLGTFTHTAPRGISLASYDLTFNTDRINALNEAQDDTEDIKCEVADNGKAYLLPGKYRLKTTGQGKKTETMLEVKKRENR